MRLCARPAPTAGVAAAADLCDTRCEPRPLSEWRRAGRDGTGLPFVARTP